VLPEGVSPGSAGAKQGTEPVAGPLERECSHCGQPLTLENLAREESEGMEAERLALGLQGVRFRYYQCPACGYADIFVDVHPLAGETAQEYNQRRAALEDAVKQLHAEKVEVIVSPP
jgi:hypothetical protein